MPEKKKNHKPVPGAEEKSAPKKAVDESDAYGDRPCCCQPEPRWQELAEELGLEDVLH